MDSAGAQGLGSTEDWAVELLRTAEPVQSAVGRKQRIWMGLSHATLRAPGLGGALFFRRMLVAGVILVLGLGTAIASAALGHWPKWAERAYESLVPSHGTTAPATQRTSQLAPTGHRRAGQNPAALVPSAKDEPDCVEEALPPSKEVFVPSVTSIVPRPTAVTRREPTAPRVNHRTSTLRARASVASTSEDAGPVLAAVRALRRDHDPARARGLLDAYMKAHPSGGLAEEALAISIEAAAAHHDADANALAGRYLRLYPTGPFHAIAERTLGTADDARH